MVGYGFFEELYIFFEVSIGVEVGLQLFESCGLQQVASKSTC